MSEIKIDNTPKPMPVLSQKYIDRFWSNVAITANIEKCWVWNMSGDRRGYGTMIIQENKKDKSLRAHRLAYFIYYGIDPYPFLILHKCDNPSCCNPHHLTLGTTKENTLDMMKKGRGTKQFEDGEKHPNAKLTVEIVQKLKEAYASGVTQRQLSIDYSINQSAVSRAINGKRWKSIYS